jgi:peptidyl-prolyl cis-trans isomerase C
MQFLAKAIPVLRTAVIVVAAVLLVPAAHPAWAQNDDSADAGEDPVVARVDGEEIRRSDVMETAASLPQQYQAQIDVIFPMLVDRLVDLKLLSNAADAADLESDPVVEERVEELRRNVIREVFLERYIDEAVSDDEVRAAYDEYLEQNPPRPEIKARHILLEKREEAVEVIDALDAGADFAELAADRSIGPSSAQGGDLGWFGEGRMVEAFSNAAFDLEVGAYTEEPVETQFGWHVIKVEDRRQIEPASYEEMEEELRQSLARTAVEDLIAGLRGEAEVEVLIEEEEAAPQGEEPPLEEIAPDEEAGGEGND